MVEFTYRIKPFNRSWPSRVQVPQWAWPRAGAGGIYKALQRRGSSPGSLRSSEPWGRSAPPVTRARGEGEKRGRGPSFALSELGLPHRHTESTVRMQGSCSSGGQAEGWLGSSSFQAASHAPGSSRMISEEPESVSHPPEPSTAPGRKPDASPRTLSSQGLGGSQGVSAHRARDPAGGTRALTLPGRNHPHTWPRDSHRSVLTKRAHNRKPLDTQEDEVP